MNQTTYNVFKQLCTDEYTDGTTIGQRLSVTRAAVWKSIQQLQNDYFVPIESSKAKGYKLAHAMPVIDMANLSGLYEKYSCELEYFLSVDSTSTYLLEKPLLKRYHVCLAEHQKAGRGRFNRRWVSPFAQNIYCSIKTVLKKDIGELSGLSLAVSVMVAQSLSAVFENLALKLKWPNDVYIQGKKVSGNIVEVKAESNSDSQVVIGIAINVNMLKQRLIDQHWTSIALQLENKVVDRTQLLKDLLARLFQGLELFEEHGFDAFLAAFNAYDYLQAKEIYLTLPNNDVISGSYQGVNALGQLQLDVKGNLRTFASGEASVDKKSL